jgi:hypothetical protein
MVKRKRNVEKELAQFESWENIKPQMKCGAHDEYFTMETDDPILAQLEAEKYNTKRGQCDHIDIRDVFRYPKNPKIIVVKFGCCRMKR